MNYSLLNTCLTISDCIQRRRTRDGQNIIPSSSLIQLKHNNSERNCFQALDEDITNYKNINDNCKMQNRILLSSNINLVQLHSTVNTQRCAKVNKRNYCGYNYCYYYFVLVGLLLMMQKFEINAQTISTKPQKFEARVGESVQLPCTFSELGKFV